MSAKTTKKVLFAVVGFVAALLCLFFFYYTARLIYINLTVPEVATRRSFGMYVGFVAFPLATLVFGAVSFLSFKAARKTLNENQ